MIMQNELKNECLLLAEIIHGDVTDIFKSASKYLIDFHDFYPIKSEANIFSKLNKILIKNIQNGTVNINPDLETATSLDHDHGIIIWESNGPEYDTNPTWLLSEIHYLMLLVNDYKMMIDNKKLNQISTDLDNYESIVNKYFVNKQETLEALFYKSINYDIDQNLLGE